jgi:fibronectin type 3 domain-containing protein
MSLVMHLLRRPAHVAAVAVLSASAALSMAGSAVAAQASPDLGPTLPDTPKVSAQAGGLAVTLSWPAVANAIAYNVYQGTVPGQESTTPVVAGTTATSATLSGLTAGTIYYFEVSAINGAGTSSLSAEVSAAALPPAPQMQFATAANRAVTLNWAAVDNATSYTVYQGTSPGSDNLIAVQTGLTNRSVTIKKLRNGSTYYFSVSASVNGLDSPQSGEITVKPSSAGGGVPVPLSDLVATVTGSSGSVDLRWSPIAGATTYDLYRGTSAGGEGKNPVVSGLTGGGTSLSGLTDGTAYYFYLKANGPAGTSAPSNEVSAEPSPSAVGPARPQNLVAAAGNRSVTLAWGGSLGASSYTLYQSSQPYGSGFTAVQTDITGTSATVSKLGDGKTYYFAVTATGDNGESGQALNVSLAPSLTAVGNPPDAPTGVTVLIPVDGGSTYTVSWPTVKGADSYSLYQGTAPNDEAPVPAQSGIVASSGTASATVTVLSPGQTYYFQVAAVGAGGQSLPSEEVSISIPAISGSKSGGGGAFGPWMLGGLSLLGLMRRRGMKSALAQS